MPYWRQRVGQTHKLSVADMSLPSVPCSLVTASDAMLIQAKILCSCILARPFIDRCDSARLPLIHLQSIGTYGPSQDNKFHIINLLYL